MKNILNYNPDTGVFVWIKPPNKRIKVGSVAGCLVKTTGYWQIGIGKTRCLAHRLAWYFTYGYFPEENIDHINQDKLDNRIINLRICTVSQNACNAPKHKDNRTGYKGVDFDKRRNKFRARIRVDNKQTHIGYFNTVEEAARAYDEVVISYHGEFANGNYIKGLKICP